MKLDTYRFSCACASISAFIAFCLVVSGSACRAAGSTGWTSIEANRVQQLGTRPTSSASPGALLLTNEPEGDHATIALEFDLTQVEAQATPLARLHLPAVTKVEVSRPGESTGAARGALHVQVRGEPDESFELVGAVAVKPTGQPIDYAIDVTAAMHAVLAGPADRRTVRLEVSLVGKPAFYEVYGIDPANKPRLEIASSIGWSQDWQQRLQPVASGSVVYREACLPLASHRGEPLALPLLYPPKQIVEVIHNGTGEALHEGRDWMLRDGQLVLPPSSHAPVQLESEFFARKSLVSRKKLPPMAIRLEEGTWYHQRQIEVSYKPAARGWSPPPTMASLANLPRLQRLLHEKAPLKIVLFGDSIAAGGNASRFQGCWPYQPAFGELVAWKLAEHYGSKIVFMNHSRGGATSSYAVGQAESQVGWFEPDLAIIAFGMNDRSENRRKSHRENMEKIIDTIRHTSPKTEMILVTPMLNNPRQPMGLGPVQFLRDEALQIARPGVAMVDMTSTHLEIIDRKPYLDTSGNGANHPNDFLHRLYAQRILEVLLPPASP